jgi:hypothetical protein
VLEKREDLREFDAPRIDQPHSCCCRGITSGIEWHAVMPRRSRCCSKRELMRREAGRLVGRAGVARPSAASVNGNSLSTAFPPESNLYWV